MPTYEYHCDKCDEGFEVTKPIAKYKTPEKHTCGRKARKLVSRPAGFIGEKVESAEYNPGLGCVTKSSSHRKEVAKRLGVEEIGNERPQIIHNYFDKARESKRKKAYDEI
jgi:putative FmdB family regulatory protein